VLGFREEGFQNVFWVCLVTYMLFCVELIAKVQLFKEIRISNIEIRNKSQGSKLQGSKQRRRIMASNTMEGKMFLSFEHWNSRFVSDFVLRISNFPIAEGEDFCNWLYGRIRRFPALDGMALKIFIHEQNMQDVPVFHYLAKRSSEACC